MLPKVKLVCILKAANELTNNEIGYIGFIHLMSREKGSESFKRMFGILKQSFSATGECQVLTNCQGF